LPPSIPPMLASPGPLPAGPGWRFEFKWDGIRAVVTVADGLVRAISRNDLDITASYPELLQLPTQLGSAQVMLDGELVALNASGVPSFGQLQQRMHVRTPPASLVTKVPVYFYVFDLLWVDGATITGWSYLRRRAALEELALAPAGPMSIAPSFPGPGQPILDTAKEHRIEGVIAKSEKSVYEPGRRSPAWIKLPIFVTQEAIVVGWKPGEGRRSGAIGSLLLGAYGPDGKLHFIGHVGSGFTDRMLQDLGSRLRPLERKTPPIDAAEVPREVSRFTHWTEPNLVGEVRYRNWTDDGRMRHPSWRGLRIDKDPTDVRVEFPR
jgi:bifunctional non-homologous end joining protein LigD